MLELMICFLFHKFPRRSIADGQRSQGHLDVWSAWGIRSNISQSVRAIIIHKDTNYVWCWELMTNNYD